MIPGFDADRHSRQLDGPRRWLSCLCLRLHALCRSLPASVLALGLTAAAGPLSAAEPVEPGGYARFATERGELLVGPPPVLDSLAALRGEGVRLIVDLRTPGEGVAEEAVRAASAGIRYVNLPVGREAASDAVLERFAALLEETNGSVLLHCASGNRAGELHARHLLERGADAQSALAAGRAGGLQADREGYLQPEGRDVPDVPETGVPEEEAPRD